MRLITRTIFIGLGLALYGCEDSKAVEPSGNHPSSKSNARKSLQNKTALTVDAGPKLTPFTSGVFSQKDLAEFELDGVKYASAEQYMMAMKAQMFKDNELLLVEIMTVSNGEALLELGRQVKNFDAEVWNAHADDIVYKGNYAKFNQNPAAKEELLKTVGTTLVFVNKSPIWGIGRDTMDPKKENWSGANKLGEILTRVRDDLIKAGSN